ncbi:DUF2637 domain-containing protein [Streptomyces sp. NPDC092296]|uniref:DUF2637 domain-containing protein n=1 Tax=Streptomyces sp. NPDC092296 TaxID=3366012 RepID=UPI003804204D
MTAEQVRSAERALSVGTWAITFGAVLYSVLTVTPLMSGHTPKGWGWTAPILPLVVDAAVVIVVRMDSTLARLGGDGGRWPGVLRWMTGTMTVALNVGLSALDHDLVGVAVHAVAPLLLIVTAETSLAYRRAIATAVSAREHAERTEREDRERRAEERQRRAREERQAEQDAAERRERERREHEARLAREQAAAEREREREQREHEARMAREEREERERREAVERAERERLVSEREREARERERREREREQQRRDREREAREAAERERREAEERERQVRRELLSGGPAAEKLPEGRARMLVVAAYAEGLPQRQAMELTGWSAGWIAARYQELRDDEQTAPLALVP